MDFRLMRAGKPVVAAARVMAPAALLFGLTQTGEVLAQQPPAGQPAPSGQTGQTQPSGQATPGAAGQPGQKNYKDRGEYDLYDKATKTTDPKAQLDVLKEWETKYPQTDYMQERNALTLLALGKVAQADPSQRQMVIDRASDMLQKDPKNFRAAYLVTNLGAQMLKTNPSPDLGAKVETASKAVIDNANDTFDASKKPASVSQADFDKAKSQALLLAYRAQIDSAVAKKDNAAIETAYKGAIQGAPDQPLLSADYAKFLVNQKKVPEALFEYAHAAQYDGPNALPPQTRQQLLDYFNKTYANYHGSDDGKQQLLDQAKTQGVPPDGLQLSSAQDAANKQASALQGRIDSDPSFKIWYAVKQNIVEKGDGYFASDIKGTELPGETVPSKAFSGTVITADPSKVTLGVEDPAKPDATLEMSQPLSADAMSKVQVGQPLQFSGIPESFTKEPYMLTFKDPTIPGVQTSAPARKGVQRRPHR